MNRDKAPGQKECDEAIDKLNMNIRDLDQASLRVLDQNLQQQTENSLQVIRSFVVCCLCIVFLELGNKQLYCWFVWNN